jgi:uncharacterized protein (DUF2225 family)
MSDVIVCPLCGFSFRYSKAMIKKKKINCPMCGFEFGNPHIPPFTPKEFNKKF